MRKIGGDSTKLDTGLPARNHLFEQIHGILWEKIRSGEIQSGQRLKDIEWARKLNVSRTPVREAMRKMQQEGVLVPLAQGGYEVRATSKVDLIELYRCRAALEALAADEAAAHFDETVAARFETMIEHADEAIERGDLDAAFALNTQFHAAVVELSGNRHLGGLLDALQRLVMFYRAALLRVSRDDPGKKSLYLERLRVKQGRHREIFAALRARDGARAAALMQAHVRETAEDLLPAVAESTRVADEAPRNAA
jgi:DNA-binding GntR family transcriptional regulator